MKFKLNSDELKLLLTVHTKISPERTLTITEGVKMNVTGNILTLVTTDLKITIKSKTEIQTGEDGNACIKAKMLLDLVKNMNDTELTFESDKEKTTVIWNSGRAVLPEQGYKDFPETPETKDTEITIPDKSFRTAAEFAASATSYDELYPILNGICLDMLNYEMSIVGTDRHIMAAAEIRLDEKVPEKKLIVPANIITVLKTIPENEKIKIGYSENSITFTSGNISISSTLINGNYPAWKSVFPTNRNITVTIDRKETCTVIKRVSITALQEKPTIQLKATDKGIKMEACDQQRGVSSHDISPVQEFNARTENEEANFPANQLLGLINRFPADNLLLCFNGPSRPLLIEPADGSDNFKAIIMPYKLS